MKKQSIYISLLILVVLLLSACLKQESNYNSNLSLNVIAVKELVMKEINAELIVKPDGMSVNTFSVYLLKDNDLSKIISNALILFPKREEPVRQHNNLILVLNQVEFNTKEKKLKSDFTNEKNTRLMTYSPDFSKYFFVRKIMSDDDYFKPKDYIEITMHDKNKPNIFYNVQNFFPEVWNGKTAVDVFVTWETNDKVYYEMPHNNVPSIFVNEFKNISDSPPYKQNARYPSASLDGKVFSYWQTDVWEGKGAIPQKMIIEGNGNTKTYDSEKVIKFDSKDNEIYVIDIANGALEVLDQTTFEQKGKGQLDKDFLFPTVEEGKLQYTCPIREGDIIVDYKVVREQ